MSKVVCKYCIMIDGIKGSELSKWPNRDDQNADEWLFRHIESEHHMPVVREGETRAQAEARFNREQPEAGGPNCKCPQCTMNRRRSA